MASRLQRRWIEHELPGLVEAGVVPPDVAARLRAHYAVRGSGAALPLFAVLGAGLIGLGVVLLLAANWEALSRALRAALCFALLLTAQGLAGFALLRRPRSAAWREATALGLSLAAAAATALIAQTYQVQGDLRSFLTPWLLLCVPLPYLFDARGVAALYLLGAAGWLAASLGGLATPHPFWAFLLLLAPYQASLRHRDDGPLRTAFLVTVALAVLAFGALAGFQVPQVDHLAMLAALVAAGLYALGLDTGGAAAHASRATPARALAGLAIVAALLALGFRDAWVFVGESLQRATPPGRIDALGAGLVALGFGALAARGVLRTLREGEWPRALLAGFPLLLASGILVVHAADARLAAAALAGLWTLALAIGTALAGMARADLRRANGGLLLLAALVFTRFADWDLSFTLRGLVFIGFGVGFLGLNLRLRRVRRLAATPPPGGGST